MHYDHIIVGQGIAGTVLSWTLIRQRKKVLVIDQREKPSTSEIALGIYNPVVFRRMSKSWKAETIIPAAEVFYADMETALNINALHKNSILKIFSSQDERVFWEKKMYNSQPQDYLSKPEENSAYSTMIFDERGSATVLSSGWVDTVKLLTAYRKYLSDNRLLKSAAFEFDKLGLTDDKLSYEDITADKIIFCEGSRATENPFFKNLQFVLTKGEVLTIRIKGFVPQNIISKGVYVLYLHDDIFKVGATYDWDDLTDIPTDKGKNDLIEKLKKVLKCEYGIISHHAGIRPTVKDRRPLIGLHPDDKRIGIFNGMGTKGVMLAPFFAQQFAEHIESGLPLDKEVDINRFNN